MANPFANLLNTEMHTLFTNAVDSMLEQQGVTVNCRLVYNSGKTVACPDCTNFPGNTGGNAHIAGGGPAPFHSMGSCVLCKGTGRKAVIATEQAYFCVMWDYREWVGNFPGKTPSGFVQIMGKMTEVHKVKRATEIIVDVDIEGRVRHTFMKATEPEPVGLFNSDYFVAFLKRVK